MYRQSAIQKSFSIELGTPLQWFCPFLADEGGHLLNQCAAAGAIHDMLSLVAMVGNISSLINSQLLARTVSHVLF